MTVSASRVPRLISDARKQAHMTQTELADRLGVSQPAVAKLERPGANPTVETLDRVLWATGHRLLLDAPARQAGVDESLIRRQLERTPSERIRGLEAMYRQAQELRQAGADAGARAF